MTTWTPTMTGSLHNQTIPNNESCGSVFKAGIGTPPLSTDFKTAKFSLRYLSSSVTGSIYCRHLNSSGNTLQTAPALDASTLTGTYAEYAFEFATDINISAGEAVVIDCSAGSLSGDIQLKANSSTSTSNYVGCQQAPVYVPDSPSSLIGNYPEITLDSDAPPPPESGGTHFPPPPLVVRF